jgi:molecular chaperone DnaJ
MKKAHTVVVNIPAGVDSGQRLRLRGEGERSSALGPAGDLFVLIQVKDHPVFKREDEHVILEMPITFAQAALGSTLVVPTLHGSIEIDVRSGTQPGETVKLKGKGIKRLNGSGYGDQFIQFHLEVPQKLTTRQKELLQQFENDSEQENHPRVSSFLQRVKEIFK